MRQIKSSIFLIRKLLEITTLTRVREVEYINDVIRVCQLPGKISVRHLKTKNQILFSTSTEYYNMCQVHVVKFGLGNIYETSLIDLSIEDKNDYFNYVVQNDPGKLTVDDIKVLKEIHNLALKILKNDDQKS